MHAGNCIKLAVFKVFAQADISLHVRATTSLAVRRQSSHRCPRGRPSAIFQEADSGQLCSQQIDERIVGSQSPQRFPQLLARIGAHSGLCDLVFAAARFRHPAMLTTSISTKEGCFVLHGPGNGTGAGDAHLEMRERKSSDCSDGEDGAALRWDGERRLAAGFVLDEPPAHSNGAHQARCCSSIICHENCNTSEVSWCTGRLMQQPLNIRMCAMANTTDSALDRCLCERRTRRRLFEE